jgi:protein-S-isoprenylcysteine O-methyltransferase Ste14
MAFFKISDDNIKKIRLNCFFLIFSGLIVVSVITQIAIYLTLIQDPKIFLINLFVFLAIVILIVLFLIKFVLKSFEKSLRSIEYIIENERLKIIQNDFEQYNITKDEIKCINKYKNNLLEVILKNNKKILVNKYLEKYDELLIELKQLSEINEIEKNPYIIQNIFAAVIAIIVIGAFTLSKNIFLVIISSILIFLFCLYLFIINFKNKNIDPKRRRATYLLLPIMLIVIIQRIVELL